LNLNQVYYQLIIKVAFKFSDQNSRYKMQPASFLNSLRLLTVY